MVITRDGSRWINKTIVLGMIITTKTEQFSYVMIPYLRTEI